MCKAWEQKFIHELSSCYSKLTFKTCVTCTKLISLAVFFLLFLFVDLFVGNEK